MVKAIILDCGGVMVSPTTGDWLLAPTFEQVLGEDFIEKHLDRFREIRTKHFHFLPDVNRIDSDEEEFFLFNKLYRAIFDEMELSLSDAQIVEIAHIQTYRDDRYVLFEDVLPYLSQWHGKYKLGIVSDAPPSTRRILAKEGIMDYIDAATFSCDVGVLKPDPLIYCATLDRLNIQPDEALFVDDMPSKLRGALDLGIRCVQMRRPMPSLFPAVSQWQGDSVSNFKELDQYAAMLK